MTYHDMKLFNAVLSGWYSGLVGNAGVAANDHGGTTNDDGVVTTNDDGVVSTTHDVLTTNEDGVTTNAGVTTNNVGHGESGGGLLRPEDVERVTRVALECAGLELEKEEGEEGEGEEMSTVKARK